MEVINWVANGALAVCGVPLAYKAWKEKGIEINAAFLSLWTIGELGVVAYVISKQEWALTMNYVCNIICIMVVWFYRRNNGK